MLDTVIAVTTKNAPEYVGRRAEMLAKLALLRTVGLQLYRREGNGPPFTFVVAPEHAPMFFVAVAGFSALLTDSPEAVSRHAWLWRAEADTVRRARHAQHPVVLFLYDADGDHGRFARLDHLPPPPKGRKQVPVRLPLENAINEANLEHLIAGLRVPAGQTA
jgi:hypothetical protein